MNFGEIIDRWAICKLKVERIDNSGFVSPLGFQFTRGAGPEFLELDKELKLKEKKYAHLNLDWGMMEKYMYSVNEAIWNLEAGLKSGKESLANENYIFDRFNDNSLIKIGQATLIIRSFNGLRVQFKNFINKLVGEGFSDVKKDHVSE